MKTTRVYVRDCSPVSAYALILFGGVLSSQPGALPPPPPPLTKKQAKYRRHMPPPPPPQRDGVLVIDGWIRFSVSLTEQRLLVGVREKLDALLASKIESPEASRRPRHTRLTRRHRRRRHPSKSRTRTQAYAHTSICTHACRSPLTSQPHRTPLTRLLILSVPADAPPPHYRACLP